jgi:hypothetical protein
MSDVRDLLPPTAPTGGPGVLLDDVDGYRLVLAPGQVDVLQMEDLILRAAASRDAVAVELLRQALGLWTGQPLLGLPDKTFVRDWVESLLDLRDRACRELGSVAQEQRQWNIAIIAFERLRLVHPTDSRLHGVIDDALAKHT